jgi:hypothetical protein
MFVTRDALAHFETHFVRMPIAGCWLWTRAAHPSGYGAVSYKLFGDEQYAHRWSWILYRGPIPDGAYVLHKCDVKCCVNPDHLFLGSHDDNMADMRAKKRGAIGDKHGRSKLTTAQIISIRSDPRRNCEIAKAYGLSRPYVSNIRRRKCWTHI